MQKEIFVKVKAPRVLGKVKHELEDVLKIALIGVLCPCEDYVEISDLIEDKAEEFKSMGFLKLTNGIPSGDIIRRVVEAMNPEQLLASLAISRENIISSLKRCHVIIDGKKLRGENPASRGCNGLYLLNMIVSECETCIAEIKLEDKTNELTALPTVLSALCLVGAVVSADAMGTHRNIAQQIIMQDGDYLMALKDNQPILRELVQDIFKSTSPLSTCSTQEKGHAREENVYVWCLTPDCSNRRECMRNGQVWNA